MSGGHSIVLLGGPDSGKTNYLVRLWRALKSRKSALVAPRSPTNIKYVESLMEFILQGEFAPHTDVSDHPADQQLQIPMVRAGASTDDEVFISVPDVSGELWKGAIERGDVPKAWMEALEASAGALLFVRVQSEANVPSLDWVNTPDWLMHLAPAADGDADQAAAGALDTENEAEDEALKLPTQVALCEMLRFLDETLLRNDSGLPRVAVMITAWDLLDEETRARGPEAYLEAEYPLFAGRLMDCVSLDVRCFGVSVVGGDFNDEEFKAEFFEADVDEMGFATFDQDGIHKEADLTLPVAWVVDPLFDDE